jgi:hypothetical protein
MEFCDHYPMIGAPHESQLTMSHGADSRIRCGLSGFKEPALEMPWSASSEQAKGQSFAPSPRVAVAMEMSRALGNKGQLARVLSHVLPV